MYKEIVSPIVMTHQYFIFIVDKIDLYRAFNFMYVAESCE